eukprot:SAG22_NODE_462_length_10207_cov_30.708647_3_plen_111_part_00
MPALKRSFAYDEEREALIAEYEEVYGEKPHHNTGTDKIRQALTRGRPKTQHQKLADDIAKFDNGSSSVRSGSRQKEQQRAERQSAERRAEVRARRKQQMKSRSACGASSR